VILDVPLVQRFVGLFLGESPLEAPSAEARRLTRLDLQMAKSVCNDIVQALVAACTVMKLTAVVGEVHSNPRSVTALPQSPSVVEIELELGPVEEPWGRAQLVLPAQAAGVLWPERQPKPKKRARRKRSVQRVKDVAVPVVAEIVRRRMSIGEVHALRVGDTIELGSLHGVTIRLGGKPSLEGEAGHLEGMRCVRIIKRLGPSGSNPKAPS
jgi:flagellar motor switch protein FliM